ncbi:TPA: hypothetical protein DCR49_08960 [Candidatus Delongbacteria bacterium]|nr:MAG: hypothetical protein A2Y39_06795 [Candidatus Delongbacteria bacterium GWF2_40_14]HAQ62103.1 hypothetical protein [Candidatus Delongbacteria bacterium]
MVKLSELLNAPGIEKFENIDKDIFVTGGKTDSRMIIPGDLYFALRGQNSDGHDFIFQTYEKRMCAAVVGSGYVNSNNFPVIYSENVEKTLGGMSKIWRSKHKAKVIGITGTNGKTTTKEILAGILSEKFKIVSTFKNYNNQIGVPLTLFSINDETEIAIVELGTNHFGEIEYLSEISDPDMGMITNIGEGHLEFFQDKKGVFSEKKKLFEYLNIKGGKIFVNIDDEYLKYWNEGKITTLGFSGIPDIKFEDIKINESGFPEFKFKGSATIFNVPGRLNLKNALAAASIAYELGITPEEISAALGLYTPADKRYEFVKCGNSQVILDCYNANPTSMENFLIDVSSIGHDFTVILGDMLELGTTSQDSHLRIIRLAESLGFSEVLLYGNEMRSAFGRGKHSSSVLHYDSFDKLKAKFMEVSEKGTRVAVKGSRGMKLEKLMEE